ncbi:MAG TPA: cysteine desulfurase family protein [Candidatus Saccharimonadales bacterium]|nr:cysteine desulfurase family protein [Candidatus Saccharimonadales bacterium]
MKRIYLDYAAATPMSIEVLKAMEPYFSKKFYNPSATYLAARAVKQGINQARRQVAGLLGAKPAEITFTAGATEANNMAIQGIMRQFPNSELLVSSIEHESVIAPARLFKHREIPVTKKGLIDLAKLELMVGPQTVLVSVMLVNNELGTVQPLAEIAKILNKLSILRKANGNNRPLYLHTDAAQAANYLDLHVSRLGVDMMSLNGGKIYGPKQSGALYVKAGTQLRPLIVGGGQEQGLRSGTENTGAIMGFARALESAQEKRGAEAKRVAQMRESFEKQLLEQLPQAKINGAARHRAPHIISLSLSGQDNERLMMELDELGIECAVGSACSASRQEASHVLSAIGMSDKQARSTLRFSLGKHTTTAEIKKTTAELVRLISLK